MKRWKYWTVFTNITNPEAERVACRVESLEKKVVGDFIATVGGEIFPPGCYRVSMWEVDKDDVPLSATETSFHTVKWTVFVEDCRDLEKGDPDAGAEPQPDLEKDLPPEPDAAAPGPEAGEG